MLIVEIAAGIVLGISALLILPQLLWALEQRRKDRRWLRAYTKCNNRIRRLSRRYSRHLLKEAGIDVPFGTDPLDIFVPINHGENKFDRDAAAEIDRLAHRADALR
jgi:hypothetical protein